MHGTGGFADAEAKQLAELRAPACLAVVLLLVQVLSEVHRAVAHAETTRQVDIRVLAATKVLDTAALDPYLYTREAFRQHRWNLLHDGEPPLPDFDAEFEELENLE